MKQGRSPLAVVASDVGGVGARRTRAGACDARAAPQARRRQTRGGQVARTVSKQTKRPATCSSQRFLAARPDACTTVPVTTAPWRGCTTTVGW